MLSWLHLLRWWWIIFEMDTNKSHVRKTASSFLAPQPPQCLLNVEPITLQRKAWMILVSVISSLKGSFEDNPLMQTHKPDTTKPPGTYKKFHHTELRSCVSIYISITTECRKTACFPMRSAFLQSNLSHQLVWRKKKRTYFEATSPEQLKEKCFSLFVCSFGVPTAGRLNG